jgi:hypothetical protein
MKTNQIKIIASLLLLSVSLTSCLNVRESFPAAADKVASPSIGNDEPSIAGTYVSYPDVAYFYRELIDDDTTTGGGGGTSTGRSSFGVNNPPLLELYQCALSTIATFDDDFARLIPVLNNDLINNYDVTNIQFANFTSGGVDVNNLFESVLYNGNVYLKFKSCEQVKMTIAQLQAGAPANVEYDVYYVNAGVPTKLTTNAKAQLKLVLTN